jgi:hypothetical protein
MSEIKKENAGAAVTAPDAKTTYETVQFRNSLSPEWAGAPAIILRHFCGVVA